MKNIDVFNEGRQHMGLDTRKPVFGVCKLQICYSETVLSLALSENPKAGFVASSPICSQMLVNFIF